MNERAVGELEIRGDSVTPGYYKRDDVTAATMRDGWLRTGDLAYLLDGELVMCGRIKDVIIVGGRPAGASLAIRLGSAGLRVRLLERATITDVQSTQPS